MIVRLFSFALLVFMFSCGQADPVVSASSSRAAKGVEDTNPYNDPRPLDSIFHLETPAPNAALTSPFLVKGKAITSFFYEGKLHYLITNKEGKALAEGYVKAERLLAQEGMVSFNQKINFDAPAGTEGFLRLTSNGASQKVGFRRSMTIPVVLK